MMTREQSQVEFSTTAQSSVSVNHHEYSDQVKRLTRTKKPVSKGKGKCKRYHQSSLYTRLRTDARTRSRARRESQSVRSYLVVLFDLGSRSTGHPIQIQILVRNLLVSCQMVVVEK